MRKMKGAACNQLNKPSGTPQVMKSGVVSQGTCEQASEKEKPAIQVKPQMQTVMRQNLW